MQRIVRLVESLIIHEDTMTQHGDFFSIMFVGDQSAFGQVVCSRGPIYYMVLFDHVTNESATLTEITTRPICLLGNFFDVLLHTGRWKTIGNSPASIDDVPFPKYKVVVSGKYFVENWQGDARRLATAREVDLLDYRRDNAPIILEEAANAYFSYRTWEPLFDALTLEYVRARAQISL